MRNTFDYYDHDVYLEHHGIKGQKWGIRRYQNPDGTLTEEGKKRYLKEALQQASGENERFANDFRTGKLTRKDMERAGTEQAWRDYVKRIDNRADMEVSSIVSMPTRTDKQKSEKLKAEREFLSFLKKPDPTDLEEARGHAVSYFVGGKYPNLYEFYNDYGFKAIPTSYESNGFNERFTMYKGLAKASGFTDTADNDRDLSYIYWIYDW